MNPTTISIFYTGVTIVVGLILVVVPRYSRRGLLFGVYVGEEAHDSEPARSLRARWTGWLVLVLLIAVAAAIVSGPLGLGEYARFAPILLLLGFSATFTWAHFVARRMAVQSHAPSVAVLEATEPHTLFQSLTLALVLVVGVAIFAYAVVAYADLPPSLPTEFDETGQVTRWIEKSIGAVLLLPFMTLAFGGFLAVLAILMTGAKRSLRHPQTAVSAEAQSRFRTAVSRFLSGVALLVTTILGTMSLGIVEMAQGHRNPMIVLGAVIGGVTFLYTIGGVIYLIARYGQGGSRLERQAVGAGGALTNGLADNRLWKLGVFYVNREDPSMFVEKRFGLGYTINFANPKAVGLMVGLLLLVALVLVVAFVGI